MKVVWVGCLKLLVLEVVSCGVVIVWVVVGSVDLVNGLFF